MFKVPDTVFWETADMAGVEAVVTAGLSSGGSSWTNEAIRSRCLTTLVCSRWRIGIPFSSAAGPDAVVVPCVCESSQFWSYREKPRFLKRLSGSMCVAFNVLSFLAEVGFLHDILTFLGEGVLPDLGYSIYTVFYARSHPGPHHWTDPFHRHVIRPSWFLV